MKTGTVPGFLPYFATASRTTSKKTRDCPGFFGRTPDGLGVVLAVALMTLPGCGGRETAKLTNAHLEPFGTLVFLPWNDGWNNHMYTEIKALRAMDQLVAAGIGWVRMDFTRLHIETAPGTYDFARHDWLVRELSRHGIAILGVLGYSPAWSSDSGEWNAAPNDPDRFAAYARATARRYRGRVRAWEIWNEPNSDIYWTPQDDLTVYSYLLAVSSNAIRQADPGALVLHGGMTGDVSGAVRRLYALGQREMFDAVNLHLFADPLARDSEWGLTGVVDEIRDVMTEHGDAGKPIWLTELGCPGIPDGRSPNPWWFGSNPTETEQADFLERAVRALMRGDKVQKLFWAFYQDTTDHFHDGIDYFGLVRADFSPKPALAAYTELIRAMPRGSAR